MANLIKKVVVLTLLLVVVFAVYLSKNIDFKDNVLIRLGLASSKDFMIPEDIKINVSDINMDKIASFEEVAEIVVVEDEVVEVKVEIDSEEGVGVGSVEAWEDESPSSLSLEDIGKQVQEIAQQVELIKKEVDILIAMNEMQPDNTLSSI